MLERLDLTNQSIKVNGVYISDVVEGFAVLETSGREALKIENTFEEMGGDGDAFVKSKFPAREISVTYLLIANNQLDFLAKFNALNAILNCGIAEISFNDESDKFYRGRFEIDTDIEHSLTTRKGTFFIHCSDPFKYSVTEETPVELSNVTFYHEDEEGVQQTIVAPGFELEYDGGYKAYPRIEVTFPDATATETGASASDCGFVLFTKDDNNANIQAGSEQEKNTTSLNVESRKFKNGKGSWADSATFTLPTDLKLKAQGSTSYNTRGLKATYGSAVSSKFYGPLCTKEIAITMSGAFKITVKSVFACNSKATEGNKERGGQFIVLFDSSKNPLYAFGIEKTKTTALTGKIVLYDSVNGLKEIGSKSFKYTGEFGFKKSTDKDGRNTGVILERTAEGAFSVTLPNGKKYGTESESLSAVKYVGLFLGKYGNTALTANRITSVSIIDGEYDSVNTFGAGNELTIDTASASLTLDGADASDIGAYANAWEDFALDIGNNKIAFTYSDWTVNQPIPKLYYRKRWL